MVEIIGYYLIFCLTTAALCTISLHIPVINALLLLDPKPAMVSGTFKVLLLLTTFFILSIIFAPAMLHIYLFPSYSNRFKVTLFNSIQKH